jgi:ribonucleoside-triphosphate reductase
MRCGRVTEVYSRVCGYFRPVANWNRGKREEFRQRVEYAAPGPSFADARERPGWPVRLQCAHCGGWFAPEHVRAAGVVADAVSGRRCGGRCPECWCEWEERANNGPAR